MTSETNIKISCKNLWKIYGPSGHLPLGSNSSGVAKNKVLEDLVSLDDYVGAVANVSFDIFQGEIFVIMGLSGSGKSTIVRCLSRLIEPTAGEVLFNGKDLLKASAHEMIEMRRHTMGMVFQNFGLMPHLNVIDNVAFPLRLQGIRRKEREERARKIINLVELDGREKSFPRELSGGQQQRVGIARSLAVEPEIWFLDEPFSSLDPLIRGQMQEEFARLQKMLNKTIVFITHDFLEAIKLADRIAIMKEGRIVQIGTPAEIVMKPATSYVAKFTKDVPRAKLIRAADCMETKNLSAAPENAFKVSADTTLEEVIGQLAREKQECCVFNSGGKIIGRIRAETVVEALAAVDRK